MNDVPEVTDLFARLASHLEASSSSRRDAVEEDEHGQALQLSLSDFNRSLNLQDDSRVWILDTALSLMSFKAPQVFDSVLKYSVDTIVGVLSSLIGCKVLKFQKDEVLVIGSSISRQDCIDLIEAFSEDVFVKLERHGQQYGYLLQAVLRVLISSSCYGYPNPSRPILDVKPIDSQNVSVSNFIGKFPKSFSLEDNKIPFRLQSWFLNPLTLKHDILNILHEMIDRPFLCLCSEFHETLDWRSITKCLALSPIMFIETRALLHRWFLLTGQASVLELLIALCSVMLDVITRPTWWDISMELGPKLPFSNAYFPHQHQLLRILSGPKTCASLLQIVHFTSKSLSSIGTQIDPMIVTPIVKSETIGHKSSWALAINFPCWFYFASALLFFEKSLDCLSEPSNIDKTLYKEPASGSAARYIAWIMNPVSKSEQDFVSDYLVKISNSLASKQFGTGTHEKKTTSNRKILTKSKFCGKEKNTCLEKYGCERITLWLKELKPPCDHTKQKNTLFRRVPLGILLGCVGYIGGDASELLLHYATTERVVRLKESDSSNVKRMKHNYDRHRETISWISEYSKAEAVAGACLVFSITDIAESMSTSLFGTEEARLDYICQVKTRVGKYLMKCILRLIQLKIDDGNLFVSDICRRLKRWRHQGQGMLEIHKDLDDIISSLDNRLSSI